MQHDVLLGRDSWMRFNDRSYRKLPPRPGNNRVLGELTLSIPGIHGATAFFPDASTHQESFHLLYTGDSGMVISRDHRLIEVGLVRSNGAPALAGCYLLEMLHAADNFSTEEHIVEMTASSSHSRASRTCKQVLYSAPPLPHCYDCLWRPSCPTPQLLFDFFVTLAHNNSLSRAQSPLLPRTRTSCCPHYSTWIPSSTICATKQSRHATSRRPLWPSLHTALLHLLCSND